MANKEDGLDKALRDLTFTNQGQDYTSTEYPRRSGRIRNCILPPQAPLRPRVEPVYDSEGKIQGVDLCDCMSKACPGCFMDCDKCGSRKCAQNCRVNRRFTFSSIVVEGRRQIIHNPMLKDAKRVSSNQSATS